MNADFCFDDTKSQGTADFPVISGTVMGIVDGIFGGGDTMSRLPEFFDENRCRSAFQVFLDHKREINGGNRLLADFLEPFWEWLFDKTGVFGLMIASFAPVLVIGLAVILILIVVAVIRASAAKAKAKKMEKLLDSAINNWEEDECGKAAVSCYYFA